VVDDHIILLDNVYPSASLPSVLVKSFFLRPIYKYQPRKPVPRTTESPEQKKDLPLYISAFFSQNFSETLSRFPKPVQRTIIPLSFNNKSLFPKKQYQFPKKTQNKKAPPESRGFLRLSAALLQGLFTLRGRG
jgi:hypothetical protein